MKIISNDDVYIQGNDLEQLLQNDKTFPLDMYYASTKGMPHVKSLTKFIKIEGEKAKKFIRKSTIIPDFGDLYTYSIEELEKMIERLKKEEWDMICSDDTLGRPQTAEERIEGYKSKKKIDYLLAQIREMVAYKRGKSMLDYPNIPNPGHRIFEIGELKATLSLQDDKIICYPEKGKTLDDIPSLAFEVAIENLKADMRDYSDDLVYDIDSRRTEDGRYFITSFEAIDEKTNKQEFQRRFKKKC